MEINNFLFKLQVLGIFIILVSSWKCGIGGGGIYFEDTKHNQNVNIGLLFRSINSPSVYIRIQGCKRAIPS